MSLRTIATVVATVCIVSFMFIFSGCSVIDYADRKPENPYKDHHKNKNITVGIEDTRYSP